MDHNEVSRQAEKLGLAMTRADAFEVDFEVGDLTQLGLTLDGRRRLSRKEKR